MRKTELIPLDLPPHLVAHSRAGAAGDQLRAELGAHSAEERLKQVWSGKEPEGQRLMLAYMAQLPFGDQEAAGQMASSSALGGRSESAAGAKCTGIECDLLLLEALSSQRPPTGGAKVAEWAAHTQSAASSSGQSQAASEPSSWSKWQQQLAALFQLGNHSAPLGAPNAENQQWGLLQLVGNMWPLMALCALLVAALQFGLLVYACSGNGSGGGSGGRAQSGASGAQCSAGAVGGRMDARPADELADLGDPGDLGGGGATEQTEARWRSADSGRRLARHLGHSLASFRLGRGQQAQSRRSTGTQATGAALAPSSPAQVDAQIL